MTTVETKVTFSSRYDEIKSVKSKNNKNQLASLIVDIHNLTYDESLTDSQKLKKIAEKSASGYW